MTENSASAGTPTPRRIVVGVDTSDNATRAAAWAARHAAELGLPLHLVHALHLPGGGSGAVLEPVDYAKNRRAEGEKLLARVADTLRAEQPGVTVTTEVSDLDPARTLVLLSADAEAVVTGTRGHGGFAGLLLGSVSLKLAVHAECPAIVVRGESGPAAVNEVVVGVEPGQPEAPVRYAFETARALGAEVRALRAWSPFPAQGGSYYVVDNAQDLEKEQVEELTAIVGRVAAHFPGVGSTTALVRGNPVPVLAEAGRGSRLIVVGAHRRRGPLSAGAGYVVHGLLSHSSAPVAVVPIV
jgi:nucleotide-binding universal stress UspA family protein